MLADRFSPELARGSLSLLVLAALADGPKYGYAIQKRLAQASGQRLRIQAGTLYPIVHRLEEEELVVCRLEQSTGRPRRWYELTIAGRQHLAEQARQWQSFAECVSRLLAKCQTEG